MPRSPGARSGPPRALLLDHGGVLIRSVKRPERMPAFADRVLALAGGLTGLDRERVLHDIRTGRAAYGDWKNGNARRAAPREVTHRELWAEFIAADWPEAARAAVTAEATALCRGLVLAEGDKAHDPAVIQVLRLCREHGIRTGIVSNTLVGALNREMAAAGGIAPYLGVQVYSDETGHRKPGPHLLLLAARALGTDPADCWYVGDNYDRDVVCGIRAGVGRTVLMRPEARLDPGARPQPDTVVHDGEGLLELLRSALTRPDTADRGDHA
ncbi:HAD family hydrolase [Streptomyces sp. NPDC001743]|uniref:HAD family hydrolase n=1 Tax=Streptomyces sp. NPDC001743 TaxID=3154397 RepID=UPI00332FEBA6